MQREKHYKAIMSVKSEQLTHMGLSKTLCGLKTYSHNGKIL